MITEDFVSFELAKLLKKKGFYQDYYNYPVYWMNGKNPTLSFEGDDDFPYSQNECVAPSLAITMKWLRNEHKLYIEICTDTSYNFKDIVFRPAIYNENLTCLWESDNYSTYEQAAEEAIKYCLENLIQ